MAALSGGFTSYHLSDNVGLLLLCEVALGNPYKLYSYIWDAVKLPKGCNSTHGVGISIPDPA
jgi:hypothetical protein